VKPAFEFGFGLSYSNFEYSGLKIDRRQIDFDVVNAGSMRASEISQIYISVPETENFTGGYRSPKSLKLFVKSNDLAPGERSHITAQLDDRAFSYWSVKDQKWILEPGTYKILIGASSRDIRMSSVMVVKAEEVE